MDDFEWLPAALGRRPMTGQRVQLLDEGGRQISGIKWGEGPPEIIYLHGGGQNAHTWDLVANLVDLPALAVDIPGHGHSTWRGDHDYRPRATATSVLRAIANNTVDPVHLIGMSLGGMNAALSAAQAPDRFRSLTLVDILPDAILTSSAPIRDGLVALIRGPRVFGSFEEMVDATIELAPHRSAAVTRRGVFHNAEAIAGGGWRWRYDDLVSGPPFTREDAEQLWSALQTGHVPLALLTGGLSSVVSAGEKTRLLKIRPDARIDRIEDAGHSVQSDQPNALATAISSILAVTRSPMGEKPPACR